MPDLPTMTVTDPQAELLLGIFSGQNDPVTGEVMAPERAYLRWLRDQLVTLIVNARSLEIDNAAAEQKRIELEAFMASLPPAP